MIAGSRQQAASSRQIQSDAETRRDGDAEIRRHGEGETRGYGETGTRDQKTEDTLVGFSCGSGF